MEIQVIRSNRKTMSIQVWQNQTVKVRVPRSMPEEEIQRIIKEKESWIRINLEKMKRRQEQLQEAETTITFDANHEMAGKELNFQIELVEVK